MSYNKLKEETQELKQTLARRTNMGNWFWLTLVCHLASRPFVEDKGCQFGVPSWPPPKQVACQTVNAGGVGRGNAMGRLQTAGGSHSGMEEFLAYFQSVLKEAMELSVEVLSGRKRRLISQYP